MAQRCVNTCYGDDAHAESAAGQRKGDGCRRSRRKELAAVVVATHYVSHLCRCVDEHPVLRPRDWERGVRDLPGHERHSIRRKAVLFASRCRSPTP